MSSKVSWKVKVLFLLWIIALRVISNLIYFNIYGPLASSSADIWFYIGVAKGYYSLFWADPLQLLLPLLGHLEMAQLYNVLLFLSGFLHLSTVILLFCVLREVYQDESAALWAATIYSCFLSSFLFCLGTLMHQQVSLPIIVALIWLAQRYFKAGTQRKRLFLAGGILWLILVGSAVGPDIWVVIAAGLPCWLAWKYRVDGTRKTRLIVATGGMMVYGIFLFLLGRFFEDWISTIALAARGIDLMQQKSMGVRDLMPLSWEHVFGAFSWMSYAWIALAVIAWFRERYIEVFLLAVSIIFSMLAVRFFFIVEMATSFLLAWSLMRIQASRRMLRSGIAAVILFIFLGLHAWRGFACFAPSTFISVLSMIQKDSSDRKLVLCNASYGFLVQVIGNAQPLSDIHHLDQDEKFMKLLVLPVKKAVAELKKGGVTHLLLTSYDFYQKTETSKNGEVIVKSYSCGNLERYLARLTTSDLQMSLIFQMFTPFFQTFPDPEMTLVKACVDPATQLQMVLYKLNPSP